MDIILKYFPDLKPLQKHQFNEMKAIYEEWNAQINVISRKDMDNFYAHHCLHSLSIAKLDLIRPGETVVDVGCGGGFPVIPLAVLMPDVKFIAVDSIGKKIKVVNAVVEALGLTNVTTHNGRIEEMKASTYDWVISRAVTDLKTFIGWTWKKTTHGILYLKGGDVAQEIADARRKTVVHDLSKWYDEEFFETKRLLHLPKR